jgi:hypothetical protein
MIFDVNLLFFHQLNTFAFTSGEYVSLAGVTAATGSTVINLGNPRDLGRGQGEGTPQVAVVVGTGITSACTGLTVTAAFQGSTDSTNWTTYAETVHATTASLAAGSYIFPQSVPRKPSNAAMPLYYRLLVTPGGQGATAISSGTLIGGIVLDRAENDSGSYPSGFTVN